MSRIQQLIFQTDHNQNKYVLKASQYLNRAVPSWRYTSTLDVFPAGRAW